MSGSSGSNESGGGSGSGGDAPLSCYKIIESLFISSPEPDVVESLEIGDVLDVVLEDEGSTPLLLLITQAGETAGSVVPNNMPRLVQCLTVEQVPFMAVVTSIDDGLIRVSVRAKS